jgi:hypothetical protein
MTKFLVVARSPRCKSRTEADSLLLFERVTNRRSPKQIARLIDSCGRQGVDELIKEGSIKPALWNRPADVPCGGFGVTVQYQSGRLKTYRWEDA